MRKERSEKGILAQVRTREPEETARLCRESSVRSMRVY
jgi:hypothetical protein